MRTATLLLAAALLSGCEADDGLLLVVVVKTDWAPQREFASVRTDLVEPEDGRPGSVVREGRSAAAVPGGYVEGVRVAELDGLARGDVFVRVQLLTASGAVLAERPVLVSLRDDLSLTVVLTRSCREVSCPRDGDDPGAIACVGGTCVDPRCGVAGAPPCPGGCDGDAECPAPAVPCAAAECVERACLSVPRSARCADGERCDLVAGCVRDVPVDAGPVPRDAGPAPVDAEPGARDTGPRPDTGPPVTCGGTTCDACRAEAGCGWCESDRTCGPDSYERRSVCNDWRATGAAICACGSAGEACSTADQCCGAYFGAPERPTGVCESTGSCCVRAGGACPEGRECCGTMPCQLGFCRCRGTGMSCGPDDECCDGPCVGGVCQFR